MNIYLDIETVPTQNPELKQDIIDSIKPPAQMKKQETIDAWLNGEGKYEGEREKAIEDEVRKTALSGTYGEILCISWAINDSPPELVGRELDGDEGELLSNFFSRLTEQLEPYRGEHVIGLPKINWIGHNISGFDLRFIFQRCVVNQVKPTIPIPYDAKPWELLDTMIMWAGLQGSNKSMQAICTALGIEGKGDFDGSQVYDAAMNGEYDKIFSYCIDDVNRTRKIYKRLNFL